jgi:RNA polymerase sigma-70 factor, ECF subfamily
MTTPAPPRWDRRMQQRLARGEEAALGELYDRFALLVHSLAQRIVGDDGAADQITRDVFGHIWENPDAYDPRDGNLRSWMATLTQRQSVRRLRSCEAERARTGDRGSPERFEARIREANTAARADFIRESMPASIRAALDEAYFQRHDYRRAARELGLTEVEARRRMRLGLQMLSTAVPQPHAGAWGGGGAVRERPAAPRSVDGGGPGTGPAGGEDGAR